MGIEVVVEGLTKSFGKQSIWRDVSLHSSGRRGQRDAGPVRNR
ncbi:hypothetical protein STENM327S_08381 [Streptomyces tendae]